MFIGVVLPGYQLFTISIYTCLHQYNIRISRLSNFYNSNLYPFNQITCESFGFVTFEKLYFYKHVNPSDSKKLFQIRPRRGLMFIDVVLPGYQLFTIPIYTRPHQNNIRISRLFNV